MKRRERIDESKNVQTTPTRTYCKRIRPLPYCYQTVGRPGTGSLPSTIAPSDHPLIYVRTGLIGRTFSHVNSVNSVILYVRSNADSAPSILFPLSPSLWETARYRLKYCLKGPLNPKPTNQKKSGLFALIFIFVCDSYVFYT